MKPRLFAGRGELPLAESKAVLFSGRPDRAGTLDTIADMTLDEKRGGRQWERSENIWNISRLRTALRQPIVGGMTATVTATGFDTPAYARRLEEGVTTVAAVVALVNLLP